MNNHENSEFKTLIVRAQEGVLSQEECVLLNEYMKSSENQKTYFEMVKVNCALRQIESEAFQRLKFTETNSSFDIEMWERLAEYEKTAPELEISEDAQPELIQKVVYPKREKRRVTKFQIVTLIMSTAAILFFFLFLHFAPSKSSVEVATVLDCVSAKWANVNFPIEKGVRLYDDNTPLLLREGVVELQFDNNARVTIEAPAEFQILDDDMMKLNYGRLYSHVPPEAYGFQISTRHTKVIDLGTEFGIKEEIDGGTEVHVIKGQVNLISRILSNKINVNLLAGSAREVDAETGRLKEIPCKSNLFARKIDSKMNVIWRGERIDLANLASGGDGISRPGSDATINPQTGLQSKQIKKDRAVSNDYVAIKWNPYVDGVFVPNGKTPQTVTSEGHAFLSCPPTNGTFYYNIVVYQQPSTEIASMVLDGIRYGYSNHPGMFMHANVGITYDLNSIRQFGPEGDLVFRSKIGVSEVDTPREFNADFWVLVDGQVRYEKRNVNTIGLCDEIRIILKPQDRFLTLVTTDGGDTEKFSASKKDGILKSTESDWCVFAEPFLSVE